jgi:hypothetical protein
MTFSFREAQRADSKALIGLYGLSGCGKTYGALMLGRGLVGPQGKLGMIDTESGRGALYADVIPGSYLRTDLGEPFSPQRYMEAIADAEQAGIECLVIDSTSHEWEGIGGVCDMALAIENRSGKPGLHCWKEPKLAHQKMMLKLLGTQMHVICCLRAKRKSRQVKDERTGKNAIVKDEFATAKQDSDFISEMTVHAEIMNDHTLRVTKVSHTWLEPIFVTGQRISIATGERLAEWARGSGAKPPAPGTTSDMFGDTMTKEAVQKEVRRIKSAAVAAKDDLDIDMLLQRENVALERIKAASVPAYEHAMEAINQKRTDLLQAA